MVRLKYSMKDTAFAYDAQVIGNLRFLGDIAYQCFRLMDVQVVDDEVPPLDRRIRLDRLADVRRKVASRLLRSSVLV